MRYHHDNVRGDRWPQYIAECGHARSCSGAALRSRRVNTDQVNVDINKWTQTLNTLLMPYSQQACHTRRLYRPCNRFWTFRGIHVLDTQVVLMPVHSLSPSPTRYYGLLHMSRAIYQTRYRIQDMWQSNLEKWSCDTLYHPRIPGERSRKQSDVTDTNCWKSCWKTRTKHLNCLLTSSESGPDRFDINPSQFGEALCGASYTHFWNIGASRT